MTCAQLEAPKTNHDEPVARCSWSMIIAAIRLRAAEQPAETAADLKAWADLLDGLAEL